MNWSISSLEWRVVFPYDVCIDIINIYIHISLPCYHMFIIRFIYHLSNIFAFDLITLYVYFPSTQSLPFLINRVLCWPLGENQLAVWLIYYVLPAACYFRRHCKKVVGLSIHINYPIMKWLHGILLINEQPDIALCKWLSPSTVQSAVFH